MLAWPAGWFGPISSITLMNEHASKSSRRNQPSKASKMASSCSSGVDPPRVRLGFDPVPRPALLAPFEEGEHELVLRGEVPVEGRLGDAGAADHLVDADGAYAAPREQLIGGVEDARSSFWLEHVVLASGPGSCPPSVRD